MTVIEQAGAYYETLIWTTEVKRLLCNYSLDIHSEDRNIRISMSFSVKGNQYNFKKLYKLSEHQCGELEEYYEKLLVYLGNIKEVKYEKAV